MSEKNKVQRQITERFLKAIDSIPDSQAEICKTIGIKPQNLTRLKSDPNKYCTLQACYNLCKYYHISAEWIHMGKGKMKTTM